MKCEIMNNEKQNEYIYILLFKTKPVKLILKHIISISAMKCQKVNVSLNYKIKFCKM